MLVKIKQKIKDNTYKNNISCVLSFCFHFLHKKFLFGIFRSIDEKFFKFLIVGFINTLFAYVIYALFVRVGFKPNLALFLQYILGVLWNFKTTGVIVFKNNNNSLLLKFILSYIITFSLNSICLYFLTKVLSDYLAQAVLVLPVAGVSFLIFKFFVFK